MAATGADHAVLRYIMYKRTADEDTSLWDIGNRVLGSMFPIRVEARLPQVKVQHNVDTMKHLRSGRAFQETSWLELVAGSRPEGLAMADGTGYDEADVDSMYLHGGSWGVHMPNGNEYSAQALPESPYLELTSEGCTPGYCRVKVSGDVTEMADKLGQWIARGAPEQDLLRPAAGVTPVDLWQAGTTLGAVVSTVDKKIGRKIYRIFNRERAHSRLLSIRKKVPAPLADTLFSRWTIGSSVARESFVEHDGETYLSSTKVLSVLSDRVQPHLHQGPSQQVRDKDLVPALICSGRFTCVSLYLSRQSKSNSEWPKPEAREEIAAMPGIIVPTGRKGSQAHDLEWRYSFSPQELRLAHDMPTWVKAGYRAFKYTLTAMMRMTKEPQSVVGTAGRSTVCTFHMKTVLLWCLEHTHVGKDESAFRIMLLLLFTLDSFLEWGRLPHYFNPECDLLETVSEQEVRFSRACVERILRDPVAAMVTAPSKQIEVQEKLTKLLQS